MKLCPFCAEEIQDAAIQCKHCGSVLGGPTPPPLPLNAGGKPSQPEIPWVYRTSTLFMLGFVVGPLVLVMLPVIWVNPHLGLRAKLGWSAAILLFSALFIGVTVWAVRVIVQFYRLMPEL